MGRKIPLENADAIVVAAERAGLPLAAACALIEKESGGRNVYGHDAGGAGPHGQPVTEANFKAFLKAVLAGATSNGVGPAQITWAGSLVNGRRDGGFFTVMRGRGLDPWVPVDNMRFGFELLAGYHAASGSWVEAGTRYNGAREYGLDLAAKVRAWQDRLEKPTPTRFQVVTFNVWVGQPLGALEANLRKLVAKTKYPEFVALQECKRWKGTIPGYVRHAVVEEGNPEAGSSVLLVRKDGRLCRERDIDVDGPVWIGPKHGDKHPPRDFPAGTYEFDGLKVDIVVVHRTPGGPESRNAESWRAEHDELRDFADRRLAKAPHRPLVIVGDQNNRKSDPRQFSITHLARLIGAKLLMRGIDGALVRGCTGKAKKLRSKYGSDAHRPVVLTLNTQEK